MKLTLKRKLFLLLVIVSLVIIILMGTILAFNLRHDMFQMICKDYESQLKHIDFAIYNFFSEVDSNVETLASLVAVRTREDSEFTSFLNADKETFQYNIGNTEQEIIDIFNNFRINHHYINSVYMGRENGSFVRSHKRAEPTKYDPRERPWYIISKENPDKVVRTEPYESVTTPDINIGVEKALVDKNGEFFGVVGMDVTLENLTNYISGIKVGEKGWAILIDENGTILVSRDEEDQLKNISDFKQVNLDVIMEQLHGYTVFNKNSKENYLFFDTSERLGWKIGLVIPVKEINDKVWSFIFGNIIVLGFSLFILGLLILIGLQKFVLNPIKKLSDSTGLIAKTGNLEHSIKIESQDEIGNLTWSFNQMMRSISKSNKALKDSEKALRRLNEELEEKVKKRTGDLAHANDRLKELDRLKSMFIASMSHELRTPLNSIIGFTGLILMGMAGKINNEQKKQLLMVKSSANHLLELITDVIDVSKIEAEQIDLLIEDFNLVETLREIKESFKILAEEKGLHLTMKAPEKLIIRSDSRRVKQIIMNFISNSFKFTSKGKIEIKAEKKNEKIRVTVSDTGIGIRKEDIKKLFKQFSRIHTRGAPKAEGTGLGLYLSKKMAALLKGKISVESVFGKGSEFILEFPSKYVEV
ncbi:MAG: Cache 3/Cache 2 fusion domain-containing protein [Elusimicrobia bacterium]|nr:Cache 3/Cache 2 fusion domain-containing protein [Elusimicrobiota bacterium]